MEEILCPAESEGLQGRELALRRCPCMAWGSARTSQGGVYGSPQAVPLIQEAPFGRVAVSSLNAKGQDRDRAGSPPGDCERGFLGGRWRMRSRPGRRQQVISPGQCLPCRGGAPTPGPSLPPARGQAVLPDAPCADSCPSGWSWLERGGGPRSMLDLIRPWSPAAWTWAGPRHLPTPSLPWPTGASVSSWDSVAGTGREDGGPRREEGKSLARVPCGAACRPPACWDGAGHGLFLVPKEGLAACSSCYEEAVHSSNHPAEARVCAHGHTHAQALMQIHECVQTNMCTHRGVHTGTQPHTGPGACPRLPIDTHTSIHMHTDIHTRTSHGAAGTQRPVPGAHTGCMQLQRHPQPQPGCTHALDT